jgi:hypothetical protein
VTFDLQPVLKSELIELRPVTPKLLLSPSAALIEINSCLAGTKLLIHIQERRMSAQPTQPSLYDRFGGIYSIACVVDDGAAPPSARPEPDKAVHNDL